MAIKTYIDGGKQAITYYNDTQPVAVYVDGDLQENVSFVPDTVQGTGSVEYISEYKKNHIEYEVQGTTVQDGRPSPEAPIPIKNANDNGMNVVLHGKNLATAQQVCKEFGDYSEVTKDGRECVSYRQNKNVQFVLEGGFKPNTQYTISFEGTSVGTNNTIGLYVLYEDGSMSTISMQYTDFRRYVLVTKANNTIKGIGQLSYDYRRTIYIDVNTFMLQEGAIAEPVYEPYFRETIEIPTSIDVDGTNVPLLMSRYDKISVDVISNKVVYTQGTYRYTFTGNEHFYSQSYSETINYGRYFITSANHPVTDSGECTHFRRIGWLTNGTATNVYSLVPISAGYYRFAFKTDGEKIPNTEFNAFIKSLYDSGNPVIVQAQRFTPIEHDITSTDLGQKLLNLDTQNQTNYFEITSNANAPQTPINFTYAKWGGKR